MKALIRLWRLLMRRCEECGAPLSATERENGVCWPCIDSGYDPADYLDQMEHDMEYGDRD